MLLTVKPTSCTPRWPIGARVNGMLINAHMMDGRRRRYQKGRRRRYQKGRRKYGREGKRRLIVTEKQAESAR